MRELRSGEGEKSFRFARFYDNTIKRTDFLLLSLLPPTAPSFYGYRRIISVGHDLCVVPLVPIYDMRCDINDGAWFIGGFGTTRRSFPTRGLEIFYDRIKFLRSYCKMSIYLFDGSRGNEDAKVRVST